jgi:hypothetical protein
MTTTTLDRSVGSRSMYQVTASLAPRYAPLGVAMMRIVGPGHPGQQGCSSRRAATFGG